MNRQTILIVLVALVALAVGIFVGTRFDNAEEVTPLPSARERTPLYYRNPMNSEVTSPVPAKDHMGMDYIPVYAENGSTDEPRGTVRIDPVTTQSIGVRTAKVEQRSLSREIRTVGRIDYDEQRIARLHPKTEGWIEQVFVQTTGEAIEADDILLDIYSPQLVSSQQEYLLALSNLATLRDSPFDDVRQGASDLVDTALERLQLFDVPDHQIDELKLTGVVKKHLHIHSPAAGTVINVGVRAGQYVTPGTELYFIADLSRIWVYVDIFEDELPWVAIGDQATMQVAAVPGRAFHGRLTYIYPYAERATRTIKARLEFDNEDQLLKPEMFADITIEARRQEDVLAIPAEAIIRSGLREKVFVVKGAGIFEPRDVVVGLSSGGWTEVREGLSLAEVVVVSAQFLIDSESKLREAASKMREISTTGTELDHPETDHD